MLPEGHWPIMKPRFIYPAILWDSGSLLRWYPSPFWGGTGAVSLSSFPASGSRPPPGLPAARGAGQDSPPRRQSIIQKREVHNFLFLFTPSIRIVSLPLSPASIFTSLFASVYCAQYVLHLPEFLPQVFERVFDNISNYRKLSTNMWSINLKY